MEGKDDIRKRLSRSTDHGDAVVQAFAPEEPVAEDFVVTYDDPIEISPY